LFTGGEDGFIRKYNIVSSLNGSCLLTGVQRHGLVDSIQKGGALVSAFENEALQPAINEDEHKVSPVYSLDVHSEGVWLVTGTEGGNIHLYTIRHQEGKVIKPNAKNIHSLSKHKKPVSALSITPNEKGLLSGSWDKTIEVKRTNKQWDLNTGQAIKEYQASSHITTISFTPSKVLNSNRMKKDSWQHQ
jgi:transcriptional activator SPT8